MIIRKLQKTEHGQTANFDLIEENRRIGSVFFPLFIAWHDQITIKINTDVTIMVPSFVRSSILPVGAPMRIETNSVARGQIGGANTEETLKFTPETFYKANIDKKNYVAYNVGFWKKGHFLCVYEQKENSTEKQIAQIDLPILVKNWLPCYNIYATDENAFQVALFFALYFDYAQESHRMECPSKTSNIKLKYTWNNELKSKYNKNFINSN